MARVALITGAAGDIGAATALAFAETGWALILLDRNLAVLPTGAEGFALACDVANPVAVQAALGRVEARFGRLDALINVAGINHRAPIADMQMQDWTRMMDVNVGSMFLMAKYGLPLLEKGDAPAIVNMSSISGHVASPDYPAYVATKAAVESLTVALSVEFGARGIRVNAVAPGWVEAGFTRAALTAAADPAALQQAARRAHVLGRMAQPVEVARAIRWIASGKAAFITGQTLFVDGGLMRVH